MKNKVLLRISLICTMLFAGLNFLPQFKISGTPIFQLLLIICVLIVVLVYKVKPMPKIQEIKYYYWYLLSSIPALFVGLFSEVEDAFLVYIYTLLPFLLFVTTFDKIDKQFYHKLLGLLSLSMAFITIIGWLLRLSFLPLNIFFDVIDSEFELGYWGIRYTGSTRNNDYLYPLVGLAISMYFFVLKKYKLINLLLIIFFATTLISSLSRAAIIISILSIVQLLRLSTKQLRIGVFFVLFLIISFNFSFIMKQYDAKFNLILNSIFKTKDTETQFSNGIRLVIINDALGSSLVNPLGYGICNYSSIYEGNNREHISNSSENAYLTILVERGWLPFIFFMCSLFFSLKKGIKSEVVNLNMFLLPFLFIYFLFNYELNNVFGTFIFYMVFLSVFFMKEDTNKLVMNRKL